MQPYRTFPITIAVDKETLEKLERLALQYGGNRSAVVRRLIANAVPEWVENEKEPADG